MIDVSRIDIYDFIANKLKVITRNVYSMGLPTENTQSDIENGFLVIKVGDLNDDSEFECEAKVWARCYVSAYVPKKAKRGTLDKALYKSYEDAINAFVQSEQSNVGDGFYILSKNILSMDDEETTSKGNQFYVFVKSFIVAKDN